MSTFCFRCWEFNVLYWTLNNFKFCFHNYYTFKIRCCIISFIRGGQCSWGHNFVGCIIWIILIIIKWLCIGSWGWKFVYKVTHESHVHWSSTNNDDSAVIVVFLHKLKKGFYSNILLNNIQLRITFNIIKNQLSILAAFFLVLKILSI